jgi:inositol monophosphatase 3
VIEGRADAYVHVTAIKKWDICAGDAILRAVNGKMTTLTNKIIDYSSSGSPKNEEGLLATTSNHEKYLTPLAKIFEDEKTRSKRDTENYRVADRT